MDNNLSRRFSRDPDHRRKVGASGPTLVQDQPASQQPTGKKQDDQVQQSSGLKEQKEAFGPAFTEGIKIVEKKEFEPSKEVASWMEKTGKETVELPEPVKDEYGQILLEAARTSKPKIVLPISKKKAQKGLHYKIADSIRWLAEWCLRLIKMFPERVVYKKAVVKGAKQAA